MTAAKSACRATTRAGDPCKAIAAPGRGFCRWHDPSAEARARHQETSRRGGQSKAYGALPTTAALSTLEQLAGADFTTAEGVRRLLAAQLAHLAALPFDTRVAYAISQTASIQRAAIETGDLERRIVELEESGASMEPRPEPKPVEMKITHTIVDARCDEP